MSRRPAKLQPDYSLRDPRAPEWRFRIDEVSAGVYRADGVDSVGRRVSRDGVDPRQLIESLVEDAVAVQDRLLRG